jgi:hypothetical protein
MGSEPAAASPNYARHVLRERETRGLGVVDDVAVTAELRAPCAEWRALLEEDPPIAQQIVRKFLTERLTVERTPKGSRLTGMATFGPLMAAIVMRGAMVPPG